MNTATEKLFEALKKKTVTAKQIQKLIADGADVNERQDQDRMSPLQFAIDRGAGLSAIKALIDAGADVNGRLCWEEFGIRRRMQDEKRDVNARVCWDELSDEDQDDPPYDAMHAPLELAARRTDGKAPAIVTALCEAGADPNQPSDDQGTVPLHFAYTRGAVEALILHGADVNARDNYGCTPLVSIFQRNPGADFDCIKALIYAGADPSFGESDNKTNAFDYIDSYCERHPEVKREEMMKLFERNKSSEDTVDDEDTWDML